MAWRVQIDDRAVREIRKLDVANRERIVAFLRQRVATEEDPRRIGRPLTGARTGLWRYRVGDYRLICRIVDDSVVVILLRVGHGANVYR